MINEYYTIKDAAKKWNLSEGWVGHCAHKEG